jgi:putative phosphoribosyl transferase
MQEYMQSHLFIFENRTHAGKMLAERLKLYKNRKPMVLGIARNGIPVAYEVAEYLKAPLDVVVTRKLELSKGKNSILGAIASGDVVIVDRTMQESEGLGDEEVNHLVHQELKELAKRMIKYSSGSYIQHHQESDIAIIVDDGLATGLTARAAIEAVKVLYGVKTIIFAAPVCARDTEFMITGLVHDVICVNNPKHLFSISNWYDDYKEVSDEEVKHYLEKKSGKAKVFGHQMLHHVRK